MTSQFSPHHFGTYKTDILFLVVFALNFGLFKSEGCGWGSVADNVCLFRTSVSLTYQNLTTLTDLHATTAFTYVETYYDITDCETAPFIYTEWRTAYVRGSSYPGDTVTITLQSGNTFVTYTFPDLRVTLLQPGDTMIMVSPNYILLGIMWPFMHYPPK
jgi:hypothetical protein